MNFLRFYTRLKLFEKPKKGWSAANHLRVLLILTATAAFLDRTDRKWIYAEDKVTAQHNYKTEPGPTTLEKFEWTEITFDPP